MYGLSLSYHGSVPSLFISFQSLIKFPSKSRDLTRCKIPSGGVSRVVMLLKGT
jgi:hypothetical protein